MSYEPTPRAPGRSRARRAFVAALLATSSVQVAAGTAASGGTSDTQLPQQQQQDIYVTAPALFRDVRPERSLDEDAVASYGVSTVDELVEELRSELDEGEEPVFVVNGDRIYDLDDIGAYPVEIIKQLQVLPRGSAPQVGGSPTQRVFNLTLQKRLRSGTLTVAPRIATEGDWHSLRGETILTTVDGRRRGNLALRVRDENSLRENQRGIIQPSSQVPFATGGNVIAYPDLSGEIDPLLTDAAGEVVTVAPFPASSNPELEDFASQANDPNIDDVGAFRTLRPEFRSYDLNATYTTPLTSWLTSTTTLRLGETTNRSLIGLATGLFVLDNTNPSSPFSVPVALAVAAVDPLRSRYRRETSEANVTLTAALGERWHAAFNGKHSRANETTDTQRRDSFIALPLDDSINPFATDLGELIGIVTDRSRSRYRTTTAQLTLTGSPFRLPAGEVNTTFEARLGWQGIHSESSFTGERHFHRSEQALRASIEVPIASRRNGYLEALGEVNATAEYSRIHFSDAGNADHTILGLTWEPIDAFRLRGSFESAKDPAPIEVLGAPTVATPAVRVFDPLTGDTVEVLYISGGNPDLKPQSTEIHSASAIVRLVPSLGLQLNAEYTDIRNRNFVSGLPPASQAVMLAFPERFIRDADGTLSIVDVRPVNFARHHQERLRWGFSLNAPLGGHGKGSFAPVAAGEDSGETAEAAAAAAIRKPPTRLQVTASHNIVLKDEILIRPGLDPVDLLNGGAIGVAGGRVRHQLEATAAVTSGGTGVRAGVSWLGESSLDTRIDGVEQRLRFSPLLTFNLKAFADARRLFPHARIAKGARLSLSLINLTDDRQKVRDPSGNTPLQYQPAYRDPLGRTIEFEIRKVF